MKEVKEFFLFNPKKDSRNCLPDKPGNYIIVLTDSAQLPAIGIEPELHTVEHEGKTYRVVYTGISTGSLRTRDYRQHFTGNNAGRSTLRLSLGSLMGLSKIPRDSKSPNRKKFTVSDEIALSAWMHDNLLLFYCPDDETVDIGTYEQELINKLNPPLNIQHNYNLINADYRAELKRLRK